MKLPGLRATLGGESGIAAVEFAIGLPVFLTLAMTGAELTNYATVKMRISQVALHLADHSARIGAGSPLAAKTVTEAMISDTLTGAGLQGGELELYKRGRVFVSSMEPVANPNPSDRYRIVWQRCRGDKTATSTFGRQGDTNLQGMGPAGSQVKASEGGATMFVEVNYTYQPLFSLAPVPTADIREIAAMPVRDRRNSGAPTPSAGVTVNPC